MLTPLDVLRQIQQLDQAYPPISTRTMSPDEAKHFFLKQLLDVNDNLDPGEVADYLAEFYTWMVRQDQKATKILQYAWMLHQRMAGSRGIEPLDIDDDQEFTALLSHREGMPTFTPTG